MAVPSQLDVVQDGLDRLLYQFRESPNYNDLVETYLSLHQKVEEICFEVLAQKDISQATGLSLDLIGRIVQQPRNNLSDELYRQRIIIKIAINNSKGTIGDIQSIVQLLTNSSEVKVFESFPASINL